MACPVLPDDDDLALDEAALGELTPAERARYERIMQDAHDVRRGVKRRPLSYVDFVNRVTGGRYQWYAYALVLASVLQRVADGVLRRVMVFAPPRHGKSEAVSRLFPAYYLYRHPTRWVGLASYGAELANSLSRLARGYYFDAQGMRTTGSVKHWETGKGGGMWSAGVAGTQAGKGFHLGIIDDPIKNAEDAASEKVRTKQREWWQSVFYPRSEPNGAIVIITTRWHEADLAGWLLEEERTMQDDPSALERWHVVNFEAIKESDEDREARERREGFRLIPASCSVEPDWRRTGEALCEERYPLRDLLRIAKRIGAYYWNALFQQRPRPREGALFKVEWLLPIDLDVAQRLIRDDPGALVVRFWDVAGTEDAGDFTVGALMAMLSNGLALMLDVARGQWHPDERFRQQRACALADAEQYGEDKYVVWGEEQPGGIGKDYNLAFRRNLAGFVARLATPTGNKVRRAEGFAVAASARNVRMARAPWNGTVRRELADFPRGANDDIVDGFAGAYARLWRAHDRQRRLRARQASGGTRTA
jgi:predicted phage terminase large subunit-like protein